MDGFLRFSAVVTLALMLSAVATPPCRANAIAAGERSAQAINSRRDPRLAVPVRLHAEGMPLSRVLRSMSEATGVRLSAEGRAGDERLVAFVPDAPLVEIMEHLAALYRLSWSKEGRADRPSYRLVKPAARAREEQALRERAFREVVSQLSTQLLEPRATTGASGRPNRWTALYPEVLPLLRQRSGELLRHGYLYLTVGALAPGDQARILPRLAPILKAQDEEANESRRALREEDLQRGVPEGLAVREKPASIPEKCTVTVDFQLDRVPRASVGIRTDQRSWYPWISVKGDDLRDEGRELYHPCGNLRPTSPLTPPAAGQNGRSDPLMREMVLDRSERDGGWVDVLRRLSETAGIAVFADYYESLHHAASAPRLVPTINERITGERLLDAMCAGGETGSFWWRREGAALVRSRGWLWESLTALPAELMERAAAAARETGTLRPADLPLLAALDGFQLAALGMPDHSRDQWHLGVRVPARLSLQARTLLLGKGIAWEALSPADRILLAPYVAVPASGATPSAGARIQGEVQAARGQHGARLRLTIWPPGEKRGWGVSLPLPGVGAPPSLAARGLGVEVRR